MGLRCKRCGSEEHIKKGLMRCKQRYLCKACGLNFTDTAHAIIVDVGPTPARTFNEVT